MSIDISGIETQVLQALGIVIGCAITYAIQQLVARMKISKNSEIVATLNDAATKAINAAVIGADATIRARGWGSVEVKNQVLADATTQLISHGEAALSNAGYDPSTAAGQQKIREVVASALPAAAASAATSPVTPPTAPGVVNGG